MSLLCSQTAYDIIKEICNDMDLQSESNYLEYGLFAHAESRRCFFNLSTETTLAQITIAQDLRNWPKFRFCSD